MISSSHLLTARKVQKSRHPTYQSQDCGNQTFTCNKTVDCGFTKGIRDQRIKTVECGSTGFCPPQLLCAAPDKLECTIGVNTDGEDPLIEFGWDERAPNLKCVFDLSKINTLDQLDQYRQKFGDSQYTDTVNSEFCEQKVHTCSADLKRGGCSRLRSLGADGEFCRTWLATLTPDRSDAVLQSYCLKHTTDDCKCINRLSDDDYRKAKAIAPFSDHCWYLPCTESESVYLVPHHLRENAECAHNICQQIIEISNARDVNLNDVKNSINCKFADGGTPPPFPPRPPNPHPRPSPHTPPMDGKSAIRIIKWLEHYWIVPTLLVLFFIALMTIYR
jgi:hypothetical protein